MTNNLRIKLLLILTSIGSYAQVGIGNTSPQGALEITSTTDGLIIPRVALTNTTTATIITPTKSELVYNTATAGDVTPGYYYWETTPTVASDRWVRLMTTSANNDWSLTGNSGTTAGTNFIGTTDAQDLRFKTQGNNRLNISNTNGQIQSYYSGAAATPAYSWNGDPNTGVFQAAADNLGFTTNSIEGLRLRENSNVSIGGTYASTNAAPNNGLRVQGQTVIGKASGEDSRDFFSSHTSATAYSNIVGYPSATGNRAIAGYASGAGSMGILGFAPNNGYGVVGLTQAGSISGFVQTGEGILGQADGGVASGIPIGNHGIIDESVAGNNRATGILGENNNITLGTGFDGGAYSTDRVIAGVYGNIGSRVPTANTNSYMFGVVGDILTLGGGTIPDGTGGVFGAGGSGQFGMLGYRGLTGTLYSVYGGGSAGSILAGNTGNKNANTPNNHIGIGIEGGFMGGFIKGNQYGVMTKGEEFGMYVQGNTITNKPIVNLTENNSNQRTITYNSTSTEVDITTRGVGNLKDGEAFVSFKQAFKDLVSTNEPINITITPTGETNGVYVSRVTSEGFFVKENLKGTSNASFNWTAIGTKAGYENGVEISKEILNPEFDKNMTEVLENDGSGKEEKSIYFDGNKVKFERIPEGQIKYHKKEAPKRGK